MSITQEFISNPTGTLSGIGGAVAVGGTAFKTIKKVPKGHVGLRTRFGRPELDKDSRLVNTRFEGAARFIDPKFVRREGELYGRVRPGFHLIVPFTHGIETIDVRNRTDNTLPIPFDYKDETKRERQREMCGRFTWGVIDDPNDGGELIRRALYVAESEEQLIQEMIGINTQGFRNILEKHGDPRQAEAGDLYREMVVECEEPMLEYGAELRHFRLMSMGHTIIDALRHSSPEEPDATRRLGAAAMQGGMRVVGGGQ
jgi:hypothetical protein